MTVGRPQMKLCPALLLFADDFEVNVQSGTTWLLLAPRPRLGPRSNLKNPPTQQSSSRGNLFLLFLSWRLLISRRGSFDRLLLFLSFLPSFDLINQRQSSSSSAIEIGQDPSKKANKQTATLVHSVISVYLFHWLTMSRPGRIIVLLLAITFSHFLIKLNSIQFN